MYYDNELLFHKYFMKPKYAAIRENASHQLLVYLLLNKNKVNFFMFAKYFGRGNILIKDLRKVEQQTTIFQRTTNDYSPSNNETVTQFSNRILIAF